ncbi:CHAP domain-containing protein [Weissella halotolerans]|nr:CHAP domain-containing protein [Weissella halotolerans]
MKNTTKSTLLAAAGAVAVFGGTTVAASADSVTVKAGDTLSSIASANNTTVDAIVAANKLDNADLIFVGDQLELDGQAASADTQAEAQTTEATAPAAQPVATASSQANTPNTYPAGQCTWYVKNALGWVGNNWGNAAGWGASAAAAGRVVNGTPAAGSVVVFGPGVGGAGAFGHVGVVESVNANGTINISEGNYAGLMFHERTVSAAGLTFIH